MIMTNQGVNKKSDTEKGMSNGDLDRVTMNLDCLRVSSEVL